MTGHSDTPRVEDQIAEIIDCSRLIGICEARKETGNYTETDSRFRSSMYESVANHKREILKELSAMTAQLAECREMAIEAIQLIPVATLVAQKDWHERALTVLSIDIIQESKK